MELRVLKYFLVAAREENITRAAAQLHVTQPTLSRQLAQLEEELGVTLFTRGNHNIRLTEDGMLLKHRAQELVTLADKTKRDFVHQKEMLSGEITIGSGEFLGTEYLSQMLAAFHQRYPRVRYRLYSGDGDNIRDQIEKGLLDAGLVIEPADIRKYDFLPIPVREKWGVWVRTDSPLAEKEAVGAQELAEVPLILASNEITQSRIRKWFGDDAARLQTVATGNLLYNEIMLAASGMGAVFGIELRYQLAHLRFVPLDPALESGTVLIWKKDQIFSPAAATFLDFIKKYKKGIADDN